MVFVTHNNRRSVHRTKFLNLLQKDNPIEKLAKNINKEFMKEEDTNQGNGTKKKSKKSKIGKN